MADSVIGALRVLLGLDTAAFSSGVKEAQSSMDALASGFKRVIAGLSIAAIGVQFKQSVQGIIDSADQIGKASEKFGIPVETLSALKFAADQADVGFESLAKGMGKLSKAIFSGAVDPSGEAAKAFKAMGVSIKDSAGDIKPTEDILGDIAERFSRAEDGSEKAAIAIKVFGKSGADLIPFLNMGRDGIKELTDQASRLGIVISKETSDKARQFNDTLKVIDATSRAFWVTITEALLPTLQDLAQWFLDFKTKGGGDTVKNFFSNLITEGDKQQVITYTTYWENFTRVFTAAKNILAATIGTKEQWDAALAAGDKALKDNADAVARLNSGVAFINPNLDIMAGSVGKVGDANRKAKKDTEDFNSAVFAQKNAVEEYISSQQKSIANTNVQAQTLGGAIGFAERWKTVTDAYVIAQEKAVTVTPELAAKITDLGIQAQNAAIALAGAQMTQENLNVWEQYAKQLEKVNQLLDAQAISAETARRANEKAALDMQTKWTAATASSLQGFSDFFAAVGSGNETMFAISKGFAIAAALINTFQAATKAYAEWGWPLGAVFAAGAVAAGLAQVAKISATKPTAKAATGGTFALAGSGGVDSRMMQIMATPGETVRVDQNRYGEESTGRTFTVAGLKPKDYYRGDVLRDLIDNINQASKDGLKIKVA